MRALSWISILNSGPTIIPGLLDNPGILDPGNKTNVNFTYELQILIRTRGLVGTKRDYFLKAFGNDHEEFYKILLMPESYIIHRFDHEGDGSTDLWWSQVCSLSDWEREIFDKIVCNQLYRTVKHAELPRAVKKALSHYMVNDEQMEFSSAETEKTRWVINNR